LPCCCCCWPTHAWPNPCLAHAWAQVLSGLGLVYRGGAGDKGDGGDKGGPFYPTPLMVELVTSPGRAADGGLDGADGGGGDGGRCVIVESNYRVYAYTASLVQHAVQHARPRDAARDLVCTGQAWSLATQHVTCSGLVLRVTAAPRDSCAT
jgi:hypothetical protein